MCTIGPIATSAPNSPMTWRCSVNPVINGITIWPLEVAAAWNAPDKCAFQFDRP